MSTAFTTRFLCLAILAGIAESGYNSEAAVAFTLGEDRHLHFRNQETLTFNKVITMKVAGNEFQHQGTFQCVDPGLYLFEVYGLPQSGKVLWYELYKNHEYIVSVNGQVQGGFRMGGNSVILQLKVGDRVYVKAANYEVHGYGASDEIYTTFTGLRVALHVDELEMNPVAFSASLTKNSNYISTQNIVYDTIILSNGNGYDNTTGIFTVPESGIYLFQYFAMAVEGKWLKQDLIHNGYYVCTAFGHDASNVSVAGNAVILHVDKNDIVKIQAVGTNDLHSAPGHIYTTFTGIMLANETQSQTWDEVAFSAGCTKSVTLAGGDTLVFNHILLNVGLHYDPRTGVFTAPMRGLYLFNYSGLSSNTKPMHLELFHNYKLANSVYARNNNGHAWGGNSAVLKLEDGDEVFIRSRNSVESRLFNSVTEMYATFSGYLITTHVPGTVVDVIG